MSDFKDPLWEKIAGKIHGELSPEEELEVAGLLRDKNNLEEYEKAREIRQKLLMAGALPKDVRAKSWGLVEGEIQRNRFRRYYSLLKYAAIIVVTFLATNLFSHYTKEEQTHDAEIFVPYGQMSQLTLSDGTKIWLNSGTTLKYPDRFAEKERVVEISGEAYFQVAKNPDKPFLVKSNNLTVKVLGTSFNYSAYPHDAAASVTLVEGKVEVQNAENEIIATLSPGQMLTKETGTGNVSVRQVKTGFYASWSEGKIFFDDERLDQIAIKLERWFNVEITFADETLKSHKFTGTILKNKPVDQIMQAFELLSPVTFTHQINTGGKDKITIFKKY